MRPRAFKPDKERRETVGAGVVFHGHCVAADPGNESCTLQGAPYGFKEPSCRITFLALSLSSLPVPKISDGPASAPNLHGTDATRLFVDAYLGGDAFLEEVHMGDDADGFMLAAEGLEGGDCEVEGV